MSTFVTTNVRLPRDVHKQLKMRALEENKSVAELIRESVARYQQTEVREAVALYEVGPHVEIMRASGKPTSEEDDILEMFSQMALDFLSVLDQLRSAIPTLDADQVERAKAEIDALRLRALVAEFQTEFPDLEPDEALLRVIGVNPETPVEEEKRLLRRFLAERYQV